ncbi:hypothetical protein K435DRAFT_892754 [Dendrothele bispora CBS 962.96]|uniref:Palmitoyltransferase n=1 Tax=Dendrothele bispora (strain CBS 962.96) TaxID=1314807 RepID=A0A4S8M2P6_DENBC|nr:hypothetical protein K435DRAFT_892754 [Dendrothele bispora CBS 962.96]
MERAYYHCRIYKRCVKKYDHRCQGINQYIRIYKERHFVMSMMYFSLSTALYVSLGYRHFLYDLVFHGYVSLIAFLLTFILSYVSCVTVGITLIISFWSVMKGKALVEAQDHEIYKKVALSRAFINSYDLGKTRIIAHDDLPFC